METEGDSVVLARPYFAFAALLLVTGVSVTAMLLCGVHVLVDNGVEERPPRLPRSLAWRASRWRRALLLVLLLAEGLGAPPSGDGSLLLRASRRILLGMDNDGGFTSMALNESLFLGDRGEAFVRCGVVARDEEGVGQFSSEKLLLTCLFALGVLARCFLMSRRYLPTTSARLMAAAEEGVMVERFKK